MERIVMYQTRAIHGRGVVTTFVKRGSADDRGSIFFGSFASTWLTIRNM